MLTERVNSKRDRKSTERIQVGPKFSDFEKKKFDRSSGLILVEKEDEILEEAQLHSRLFEGNKPYMHYQNCNKENTFLLVNQQSQLRS
jgi:hypothetical protein